MSMKINEKPFLIAIALVAAPFAAQAETINLYGWQNHSWEFVDNNGTSFDRIQSNAGNIGFAASVDTGMNGIHVNLQCEQFTYFNHYAGGTGWCNRNSKIGLSHPDLGEIMLATWLLPYNEGVAQWVDPFYDAGADSHTSIMGSVGATTIFYNTGDFDSSASNAGPGTGFNGNEFNYAGAAWDTGFNRRQEGIIQYWSPNWNGFVFRFAWTVGKRDETTHTIDTLGTTDTNDDVKSDELDPVIRSSSLAYTNGPLWLAVTWQEHEDWTADSISGKDPHDATKLRAVMKSSDAESIRLAGRYIMDMGDGMSVQLSAMYEDLEYEFDGVVDFDTAMTAFGYPNSDSYKLNLGTDDSNTRASVTANSNVKFEREAWMISGKIKFGGPLDFRFSYMDADDLEVSCGACTGDWQETAADAWNVGLFYTMPAGTELRVTYSEVDNDDNGSYGQGISGTGLATANSEVEMFALGIVHWFD